MAATTSSSSTESGCEGSVDDKTDEESSIDELIDDVIHEYRKNQTSVAFEKPIDSKDKTINNESVEKNCVTSSNGSIIAENSQKSPKFELENSATIQTIDSTGLKSNSITQIDKIDTQNLDGETKTLIDDVLKEFENPTSIYISKKENNENQNNTATPESEPFSNDEESNLAPRRASGAKASQIIKENSEILEKIMRKRVNSMAGSSVENQISLDKEELDDMDNNSIKESIPDRNNDTSNNQLCQPNSTNQNEVNHNMSKTSATPLKKDTVKTKSAAKHFPAVSTMGPVKPQLSKPQLNQTGGIVVQQRSDGRLGGQNSTKPITFNPFPNSSRIGQRKSNEVGRKLGLYPSNK